MKPYIFQIYFDPSLSLSLSLKKKKTQPIGKSIGNIYIY